jgi:RNA-directed DNA polymerase
MYVERWLKAGIQKREAQIVGRTLGTLQGGMISALLANIYLQFTFDKWMGIHFSKYTLRALL